MGWFIRLIIGGAIVFGVLMYHKEIINEVLYQIEETESDSYDDEGNENFAYDDYDTDYDYE